MLNAKLVTSLGFQGGEDVVLCQILYPGNENATIEDRRGVMEHVGYSGSDDREGRPAGDVVASAVDCGAAGGNVEAGNTELEP